MPLIPGSRTSRIKHPGTSTGLPARKSRGEQKVSARIPADSSRFLMAAQTATSSSTTKTIGSLEFTIIPQCRQGKVEGSAGAIIDAGPQASAVCLDDGPGDGQTH